MKKLLLVFAILLSSIIANAETIYGKTTGAAIWNSSLNDWQAMQYGEGIDVVFNANGAIYIYSKETQCFKPFNLSDQYYNKDGHIQYTAEAYDSNGVKCGLRFVNIPERNTIQIYVYYNNISYVYEFVILPQASI